MRFFSELAAGDEKRELETNESSVQYVMSDLKMEPQELHHQSNSRAAESVENNQSKNCNIDARDTTLHHQSAITSSPKQNHHVAKQNHDRVGSKKTTKAKMAAALNNSRGVGSNTENCGEGDRAMNGNTSTNPKKSDTSQEPGDKVSETALKTEPVHTDFAQGEKKEIQGDSHDRTENASVKAQKEKKVKKIEKRKKKKETGSSECEKVIQDEKVNECKEEDVPPVKKKKKGGKNKKQQEKAECDKPARPKKLGDKSKNSIRNLSSPDFSVFVFPEEISPDEQEPYKPAKKAAGKEGKRSPFLGMRESPSAKLIGGNSDLLASNQIPASTSTDKQRNGTSHHVPPTDVRNSASPERFSANKSSAVIKKENCTELTETSSDAAVKCTKSDVETALLGSRDRNFNNSEHVVPTGGEVSPASGSEGGGKIDTFGGKTERVKKPSGDTSSSVSDDSLTLCRDDLALSVSELTDGTKDVPKRKRRKRKSPETATATGNTDPATVSQSQVQDTSANQA